MSLRDPLAFLLITVLILSGWGGLFVVVDSYHEAACTQRTTQLLLEQREGPLEACAGIF